MRRLLLNSLIIGIISSTDLDAAASPVPQEPSRMRARADILGITLGMGEADAKNLTLQAIPNARLRTFVDEYKSEPRGWDASPQECHTPGIPGCIETIVVRLYDGKVWYVRRVKSYRTDIDGAPPTMRSTLDSIVEKYGSFVGKPSINSFGSINITNMYYKAKGGYQDPRPHCGGGWALGGVPSLFTPSVEGYFEIQALRSHPDVHNVRTVDITFADCDAALKGVQAIAKAKEAAAEEKRLRDESKATKPRF